VCPFPLEPKGKPSKYQVEGKIRIKTDFSQKGKETRQNSKENDLISASPYKLDESNKFPC